MDDLLLDENDLLFYVCKLKNLLLQKHKLGDVVAQRGRGPGFETGIFHNDPNALRDHCVLCNNVKHRVQRGLLYLSSSS